MKFALRIAHANYPMKAWVGLSFEIYNGWSQINENLKINLALLRFIARWNNSLKVFFCCTNFFIFYCFHNFFIFYDYPRYFKICNCSWSTSCWIFKLYHINCYVSSHWRRLTSMLNLQTVFGKSIFWRFYLLEPN